MNRRLSTVAACALVVAGSVASSGVEATAIEGIERYCVASWRQARIAPQDWSDCTQQVFLRLLDRISRDGLSEAIEENASQERRELNRAIWATTKRWQRARREQTLTEVDVAASPSDDQISREVRRMIASAEALSPRQRDILQQTIDGATVREIADELDVPAARVSDDKYKAIQKLRTWIENNGASIDISAA